MPHTITISLPDILYDQLQRTAAFSRRSIDAVIADSLSHNLTPLLEDIPAEYQSDVYPLLAMDAPTLQAEVQRVFPMERWAAYEALLERLQESQLTPQEHIILDGLRREADLFMLRKAYAAVLLKRRGVQPPALDELPAVSA
jgi:hypothetical protein